MSSTESDTAAGQSSKTVIDPNSQIQKYYCSLESRIGYRLLLGGTRHLGYWEHDTWWPFPLSNALRAMEDRMAAILSLPKGSRVLDAGCGVCHVALRLAQKHGLRVTGIDLIAHHVEKAKRNIAASGLPEGTVTVQHLDYHHIESFASGSLDGVYTMETFVHSTKPEAVLTEFYRILRPGGHIAMHEYEYDIESSPGYVQKGMISVNEFVSMPMNRRSQPGVIKKMLEDAGFVDVVEHDYSDNVRPLTRVFFFLAFIPFFFIYTFRLDKYFINTVGGFGSYPGLGRYWRYKAFSGRKPGPETEPRKTK